MIDFTNPRRQGAALAAAERAVRHSEAIVDPRTRTLYRTPSQASVDREYRALDTGTVRRRGQALHRLDRWGYEGRNRGQIAARRVGRFAIPESSLKRTTIQYSAPRGGAHVGSKVEYGEWHGHRYIRQGDKWVPIGTLGDAVQDLRDFPAEATKWVTKHGLTVDTTRGVGGRRSTSGRIATATPSGFIRFSDSPVAKALVSDLINIPAQAIPSMYELGAAAFEANRGDTSRGERLWKEYKQTGVLPGLVSGGPKEFARRLGAHPIAGLLELRGGQVGLTRTAARGAVRVSGAVGGRAARDRAARILSTQRGEDVPGLGFVEKTRQTAFGRVRAPYSRDLATKAGQVARDRRERRRTADQGRPATILTQRDIDAAARGRVDHAEGVSELLRREGRKHVEQLARHFPPRYAAVGRLVLEGEVRRGHMREDLARIRRELDDRVTELTGQKRAQNRQNAAQIDAALADEKLLGKESSVFRQLEQYAGGLNRIDAELEAAGYRAPAMEKSKHVPWLVRHEGARSGTRADAVLTDVGARRVALRDATRRRESEASTARGEFVTAQRQAAREYGATACMVRRETARLERADPKVRAAAAEYNAAIRERRSARTRLQNARRAPSLHSPDERSAAARGVIAAQARFEKARVALGQERDRLGALVEDGRVSPELVQARARVAQAGTLIEQRAAQHALAPLERRATRGPGRQPTAPLSRLERARADEALAGRRYGEARVLERDARAEERAHRAETRGRRVRRVPWMLDAEGQRASAAVATARRQFEATVPHTPERQAAGQALRAARDEYERIAPQAEITEDRLPALAAKHGINIDGIAWVSQRGFELSERGAHYQRGTLGARPFPASQRRTGEATLQGVVDLSRDAVLEDAFRRRSILDAVDANLRMLNSVGAIGLRVSDETGIGGFRTAGEAKRAFRELRFDEHGNERPWVPEMEVLSLGPFYKTRQELGRVAERVTEAADMDEFAARLLGDYDRARLGDARTADTRVGEAGGPFILVPKVALDQAAKHARNLGPGDAGRAFQALTHQFRQTVLLTSSRWLAGNVIEMMFRTLVEGAGPRSWYVGRQVLNAAERVDPARAAELRVATTGGAHMASVARYRIRRSSDQFEQGGVLRPVVRALEAIRDSNLSPAHYPVLAWRLWSYVIRGANTWAERQGQFAALGKAARREWGELTAAQGRSMLTGERAFDDLARGMLNTPAQVRFAHEVDTIIGKYDRLGPQMRYAMTTYAPFLAWYVNALRFVFATLPGRHPVKTAILASTYATQAEKQRDAGYDLTLEGAKPGFLQGSLELDGDTYRLSHYFPFSAVAEGAAPLADQLLPQFGFLQTAAGLHFTGQEIKLPDGTDPSQLELFGLALNGLGESLIPFMSVARRVRESGGSSHPTSTIFDPRTTAASGVEPDSDLWGGLERVFNPFYPVGGRSGGASQAVIRNPILRGAQPGAVRNPSRDNPILSGAQKAPPRDPYRDNPILSGARP